MLPAEAHAKISFRLVGDQDPRRILESLHAHVRAHLPPDCSVEFIETSAHAAISLPVDAPAFMLARKALSEEWPRPAVFVGGGFSIPIVEHIRNILGMDVLLIGFGREDDNVHSPNEKYDLESFHKGARSWARVLAALIREVPA